MKTGTRNQSELQNIKASDVMTAPVTTVRMWDSVADVARIFSENNISAAAVVDMQDAPLGVITKTDLARYGRERAMLQVAETGKEREGAETRRGFHLEPEDATIESWMTPALFQVAPAAPLAEAVREMVKNGLHHILVIDPADRRLAGIVTSFDVLMVVDRILNASSV